MVQHSIETKIKTLPGSEPTPLCPPKQPKKEWTPLPPPKATTMMCPPDFRTPLCPPPQVVVNQNEEKQVALVCLP